MTGTPLIQRPSAPPPVVGPPSPTSRGDRIFGIILLVLLLAGAMVVALATNVTRDATDTPNVPVDEPAQPAQPAEEPNVPAEPDEPAVKPPTITYGEELRANWIVVGLAAGDELNVRSGPGVAGDIIATLTETSPELESTGRIATVGTALWREIVVPGDGTGWVNTRYLGDIPPPASNEIRYREEPRANWDVDGVAADDVLNVRIGPGVSSEIVHTLPPDTVELESTGRIADVGPALWREIVVPGDGTGWVNAAYLDETG